VDAVREMFERCRKEAWRGVILPAAAAFASPEIAWLSRLML
jgi:hypothetical protein